MYGVRGCYNLPVEYVDFVLSMFVRALFRHFLPASTQVTVDQLLVEVSHPSLLE